jgi:hypothetical protein
MDDLDQRIRERAHRIWLEEGCPAGREKVHWDMATELVAIEDGQKLTLRPIDQGLGPNREPVEPASAAENGGDLPTLTDQGESEYPTTRREEIVMANEPAASAVETAMALARNNGPAVGETVGVDKIRDLLFGNQMQDYDQRFGKLEECFLQRFRQIESETARNLGVFESNAKKQADSLANQLREEKEQRADGDKEIERTLREQNQAPEKRIRSLSDQLNQLDRDMNDRVTRESHSLHEELKQKNADLTRTIETLFNQLTFVKTDRTLLASLFIEVAKCLNQNGNGVRGEALHGATDGKAAS